LWAVAGAAAVPLTQHAAFVSCLLLCLSCRFCFFVLCSAKLESLVGALLERTKAPCMQCMKDAGELGGMMCNESVQNQ
jgi:hypothetical protein